MRHGSSRMPGWLDGIYRRFCANWAVPELAHRESLVAALKQTGFSTVTVQDISWRVGPSVMHVPLVVARYLAKHLARRDLNEWRRRHALASFLSMLLGLARPWFCYSVVYAVKDSAGFVESRPARRMRPAGTANLGKNGWH
jgi:hypothetical protein